MAARHTPLVPALLFLAVMLVYLIVEIGYNAWLLDVAGSGTPDPDELHRLELFGRALAAVGFTLFSLTVLFGRAGYRLTGRGSFAAAAVLTALGLVPFFWADGFSAGDFLDASADWIAFPIIGLALLPLAYKVRSHPFGGAVLLCFAVGMGTVTGMFHGQLIAIERLVVDASDAEDRWQAQHLNLLRTGYDEGVIRLGDVTRSGDTLIPEERTLLAFTGVLFAGNDDPLFEHARAERTNIIGALVDRNAATDVDAEFKDYQASAQKFIDTYWEPFKASVARYENTVANASAEAADAWNESLEAVAAGWRDYQAEQARYEDDLAQGVEQIRERMKDFVDAMERCQRGGQHATERCEQRVLDAYDEEIEQALGEHVPWQDWCREMERGESFLNRLRQGEIDIDGLIGLRDAGYICPADDDAYLEVRLDEVLAPQFEESSGYPIDIGTEGQFRAMPKTAEMVRARMRDRGVHLPSDWTLRDRETFIRQVEAQVQSLAEAEWEEESESVFGTSIEPMHSYEAFEAHPAVQSKLQEELDRSADERVRLTLNREEFRQAFIVPEVEARIERTEEALRDPARYADGEELEADGREAMRGLWVPAISLSLSLFFGLLGTVKVIISLVMISFRRPLSGRPMLGVTATVILWGTLGLALIAGPFASENRLTRSELYEAYQAELVQTAPLRSFALEWLLRAQPLIAPVGERIAALAPDRLRSTGSESNAEEGLPRL